MEQSLQLGAIHNSWWYLRKEMRSRATMVYGNIYDLPGDIGLFDVATFQAILLHLRDPFSALEQAARRTVGSIVVTEPVDPAIENTDSMRFFPTRGGSVSSGWWSFSAATIEAMLDTLGFHNLRRTEHTQTHYQGHDLDREPVQLKMFTVVGSK
jgi:O-methyltransferase